MKKLIALLLVAVLAAVAFGCAAQPAPTTPTQAPAAPTAAPANTDTPEPEPTEEQEDVVVCWMGPISGPYASYGTMSITGCKLFEYFWEEKGGFEVHTNRNLVVRYEDNEGNAEVAMALFERIVDEIDAFAFANTTLPTIACQPLLTKYEKPMMFLGATADRALEENNPWTFRATAGDKDIQVAHEALIAYLAEVQGHNFETFAVVHSSDDGGVNSGIVWSGVLEKHGATRLLDETVQTAQTTDVSGIINRLKSQKPDVVIACMPTLEASLFQKGLREYHCDVPIVAAGNGYSDPEFFSSIGPGGADGVVSTQTWVVESLDYAGDPAKAHELYDKCKEITGEYFTEHGALAWCGFAALVEAIDRAESLSGQDIVAALKATDLPQDHWVNMFTQYAGIKFEDVRGRYNQNTYASCIYAQLQNDEWHLVMMGGKAVDPNPVIWPVKAYAD